MISGCRYNPPMPYTQVEPTVEAVAVSPAALSCDLLVVPVFEDDAVTDITGLDAASGGEVSRARSSREFRPKPDEMFVTHVVAEAWKAARLALVGLGAQDGERVARLRRGAATALRNARRRRAKTVGIVLRGDLDLEDAARAVTEGLLTGSFDDRRFKTDHEDALPQVERCLLICPTPVTDGVERAVAIGRALGDATNRARELANAPGNALTPRLLASRAQELVSAAGVQVEVLDEAAIENLGMGLLLGVARGSAEPPRVIVMRHEPADAPRDRVLGLVGKGVTFDSGGISLKQADGMEEMKGDMAGGAAVICAMRAIGTLGIPTRVIGIVPTTENMPGGRAIKPGDVLTSASGTSVEIINTDAEGRLILGDALWYARELGATHLVDVATLTGACVVALGKLASGVLGQPPGWVDSVRDAAEHAGERVWPLPLYDEYREQLRSETADLMNSGGRAGGACTAAAFLKAFTGDAHWAHVDIAGTAWVDDTRPSEPKGATGVMVRTLTELAGRPQTW